jgi:hypothetical protein
MQFAHSTQHRVSSWTVTRDNQRLTVRWSLRGSCKLDQDCPDARAIMPRTVGKLVAIPQVGGLHHRYERLAA